jgi:tetratricopeptide (TPR) repeat protein
MGMYQEALEIHGRIGDLSRIAYDIGSIGEIHLKVRKHQEALERFEEVERISLEVGDRYSVAYAHEFIGRTLHGLGRFEEALDRFRLQLQAAVSVGDAEREARAHGWLGIACAALGRAGEATAHLNRAVASSEALGSEFLLCEWHYHLAWLPPAAAGDVRGHNRRAAELAARMGRRDMSFLCGVQEAVIDFLESGDEMGRERAVDALRVMMEERNDKQGKARLYYECWRLLAEMGRDGDAAVMGRKAARLYSDLTEESDGAEYRDKLDRLRYGGIDI